MLQKETFDITSQKPILSTSGGTSDARLFAEFGVKTVELGVINDRIHAINERCKLQEVEDLEKIFEKTIKDF